MNKKIWTKVLATLLVFTLTCANFILLGIYAGSTYASNNQLEMQSNLTNNENVEFDAYFKDEVGKKVHKITNSMTKEDIKLYLAITLKKGYLKDAKVQVLGENNTNSNFNITNSNGTLEMIEKLDTTNNMVYFKQINSGTQVIVELPIIAVNNTEFDLSNFSKINDIKLTGNYIGDLGKKVEIEKTIKVRNQWQEEITPNINQEVLKFIPYSVQQKQGTILQTLITTGIQDNILPIEQTKLTIKVPKINEQNPDKVQVTSNGTFATNGKNGLEFTKDQYHYNEQTGILEINVKNEAIDNKILWNKDKKDEYVITYIYKEKLEEISTYQETTLEIKAYNNIETKVENKDTLSINTNEKQGEIVSLEMNSTQAISKGTLYAKQEKENLYNETLILDIVDLELVEDILIQQNMDYFVNADGEANNADTYYKETKINKQNFEKILGQDGYIKILTIEGQQLAVLNKDTKEDENGNYTFTYEQKTNQIKIQTNKPISIGKLQIEHTKALNGKTDYTKGQIESFNNLELTAKVSTSFENKIISEADSKKQIELINPLTKLEANVNIENLSTVVKNENVEFRVILKNNDLTCDLYKNPIVEIVLPSDVKQLNIKDVNLLFDNELKIKDYTSFTNENGNIVIKVNIEGEQTKYSEDEISKGANLIINTDITLKQLTPTKEEQVNVYVTNENVTQYEQTKNLLRRAVNQKGYTQVSLKSVAPVGLVTTNTITDYNSKNETITSISGEQKIGKLEVKKQERTSRVNLSIINNYPNKVNNISILGRIPSAGNKDIATNKDLGSNIDLNLVETIKSNIDSSKLTIYYSQNKEATKDLMLDTNLWTTKTDNLQNMKSYLIVLNDYEMNTGDILEFSYKIQIPENLNYNMQAYSNYIVYFNNVEQKARSSETSVATSVGLETGNGPELEVTLDSNIGNNQTVEEGKLIKYTIKVKNVGKMALQNVKVSGNIPKGSIYTYYDETEGIQDSSTQLYDTNKKEYVETIPNIEIGETKTIEYLVEIDYLRNIVQEKKDENGNNIINPDGSVEVERVLQDVTLTTVAKAMPEGYENVFTSNEIVNKVNQGYIDVKMEVSHIPVSYPRAEKDEVTYRIIVKNVNTIEKQNVILTNVIPEGLSFKQAKGQGNYNENNKTVTWDIGTLGQLQEKMFLLTVTVDNLPNNMNEKLISNKVVVKTPQKEISSNEISIRVQKPGLTITQNSDTKSNVLVGDTIVYHITIKNLGSGVARSVKITDIIPEGVRYTSAQYSIEGKSTDAKIGNGNAIVEIAGLNGGSTVDLTIKVIADKLQNGITKKEITNIAKVEAEGISEILSNPVTHTIVAKDTQDNDNNNTDKDDPSVEKPQEGTYAIKGIAWIDANKNGKRDNDELRVPRIPVILINAENGQIVTDITTNKPKKQETNDNGEYTFLNLKPGKYMVVFLYDSGNYGVTEYRKTGVNNDQNSDVIEMNIEYEGTKRIAGVSNTINIKDENIENIDIGLIVSPKFDLKLEKIVSKITLTDSNGTKTYEYKDEKTAKLDLDQKTINGSTIMIEYKIRVTNEGGVAGYAKKIVDYMPQGTNFTSELNKDWYMADNKNLYNTSLANTIIQPGETKEVTLLLTRKMTNDNTGIINNIAEIQESYNDLGLNDIDSVAGNKVQTEDDISSADVIIGIKTGEIYIYIALTISLVTILGVGIYLINKKVLKKM